MVSSAHRSGICSCECEVCHDARWVYNLAAPVGSKDRVVPCEICRWVEQQRMRLLAEANDWTPDMDLKTFKAYDLTVPGVQEGYDAAREFAKLVINCWKHRKGDRLVVGPEDGWAITLWGAFGAGKTHLSASIGNAAKLAHIPVLYSYAPNLWAWLGCTPQPDPDVIYEGRFAAIAAVPLLILDEPGGSVNEAGTALGITEAVYMRRRRLVEHRYMKRMPTVFLDNRHPRYWGDGAVASRVDEDANETIMHGELDYRNRQKRMAWESE